jgi:hypothetical protein
LPTKYRSGFEGEVGRKLNRLHKGRYAHEIEKLSYTFDYVPDYTNRRTGTIVEAKGYLDAEDVRKMRAVRKAHPDRRIILCFMKPNQKLPKKQLTHAEWAIKNGFEWCTLETLKDYV